MHRRIVLELLERYETLYPDDPTSPRLRRFVDAHEDCLERSCRPGHVTASAWILSPAGERALLTHHRKLDRWLQLGGHVDGNPDVSAAARREAEEESGIEAFSWIEAPGGSELTPLDVDIHRIPARKGEPEHDHHDLRFLIRAETTAVTVSDESHELRWCTPEEVLQLTDEESVLRLQRKAARWLEGRA